MCMSSWNKRIHVYMYNVCMVLHILGTPGITIFLVISIPGLCHSKTEGSRAYPGRLVLWSTWKELNNGTQWLNAIQIAVRSLSVHSSVPFLTILVNGEIYLLVLLGQQDGRQVVILELEMKKKIGGPKDSSGIFCLVLKSELPPCLLWDSPRVDITSVIVTSEESRMGIVSWDVYKHHKDTLSFHMLHVNRIIFILQFNKK